MNYKIWLILALLVIVPTAIAFQGEIGSRLDRINATWINPDEGEYGKIIAIDNDTYAIVYAGASVDGYISTFNVTRSGEISAFIDTVEFVNSDVNYLDIIRVPDTNVFLIGYQDVDASSDGFVCTINITDGGDIQPACLDKLEFDPVIVTSDLHLFEIGDGVYGAAYRRNNQGHIATFNVSSAGIMPASTNLKYNFSSAITPHTGFMSKLPNNKRGLFALAGTDGLNNLMFRTYNISNKGYSIRSVENYTVVGTYNTANAIWLDGDTLAVVYRDSSPDGYISTINIDSNGNIENALTDQYEFEEQNFAGYPASIQNIGGNTYIIQYVGAANRGYLKTINILSNGTIETPYLDNSTYAGTTASQSNVDIHAIDKDTVLFYWYNNTLDDLHIYTYNISMNFTLSARNGRTLQGINVFNATINGTTWSTLTGEIITNITSPTNVNVKFVSDNFYNRTYTGINSTFTLRGLLYDELLDDCTYFNASVINTSCYNERTSARMVCSADTVVVYNYTGILNNVTFPFRNRNNYSICMATVSGSMESDILYNYYATGYDPRSYYASPTLSTNVTHLIYLYLLNQTFGEPLLVYVRYADGTPVNNTYVKLMRYNSSWQTMQLERTVTDGSVVFYIEYYNTFYRFIVENDDGTVLYTSQSQKIYSSPQYLFITPQEGFMVYYDELNKITYSLTYNVTNLSYLFTYNDGNNLVQKGCLDVVKRTTYGDTYLCQNCTASTAATLRCNISNVSGNYIAIGWVNTSHQYSPHPLAQISTVISNSFRIFGVLGVFGAFLIIGTVGLMFSFNPSAMIIGTMFAAVLCAVAGLITISTTAIMTIIILGLILAFKVRT